MKILVSERLSENKYKTPEGYLICVDSVLARTGSQTYSRGELFGDNCKDSEVEVEVDRNEKEVFSPKTLASFENKPITVQHPDVDVNSSNHGEYAVGFVRDIKKGNFEGREVILGTLVITDAQTIEEIENDEHKYLSCGYDCDIKDIESPEQTNIRGNHVALCDNPRAGITRIVDDLYGLIKEDKYKYFLIDYSWLSDKWGEEEGSVIIKAINEKEAKDKFNIFSKKHKYKLSLEKIRQATHSDYIKYKRVGNAFDSKKSLEDKKYPDLDAKAKELKAELGLYKKQIGSHAPKGIRPYTPREKGPQVEDLNEAINDAIENLSMKNYDKSAWIRLSLRLEGWKGEEIYKNIAQRAARAIKKFENYVALKKGENMKDAINKYEIRWTNPSEKINTTSTVKAKDINQALKMVGDLVVMKGMGVASIFIRNVKNASTGKDYDFEVSGNLSNLLKKRFKDSEEDLLISDEDKYFIVNYYWLSYSGKENDASVLVKARDVNEAKKKFTLYSKKSNRDHSIDSIKQANHSDYSHFKRLGLIIDSEEEENDILDSNEEEIVTDADIGSYIYISECEYMLNGETETKKYKIAAENDRAAETRVINALYELGVEDIISVNTYKENIDKSKEDSCAKDAKISVQNAMAIVKPVLKQYMTKNHPDFKEGVDYGIRMGRKINKGDKGSPGQIIEVFAELGYNSLSKLGEYISNKTENRIGNYFEPDYSGVLSTNIFDSCTKDSLPIAVIKKIISFSKK